MNSYFARDERQAAEELIRLALAEDLRDIGDLTCQALVSPEERAEVLVVAREPGVFAGGPVAALVFEKLDPAAEWHGLVPDGATLERGTVAAKVTGPLSTLLTGERTALNFLQHLSGVATLTRKFVDAVAGTRAEILDTRKTIPGWRSLDKYAVRAGGGTNHRLGLYDGCLIKDNHLAAWSEWRKGATLADAVREARQKTPAGVSIEIEVDTLEQLADALGGAPDIVLLDNMPPDQLRKAVAIRDNRAPKVLLEASGGVTLETVAEIAKTGVERISSGALTHSARALDLAFDWSRHVR